MHPAAHPSLPSVGMCSGASSDATDRRCDSGIAGSRVVVGASRVGRVHILVLVAGAATRGTIVRQHNSWCLNDLPRDQHAAVIDLYRATVIDLRRAARSPTVPCSITRRPLLDHCHALLDRGITLLVECSVVGLFSRLAPGRGLADCPLPLPRNSSERGGGYVRVTVHQRA